MSNIGANLPNLDQEIQRSHPLIRAQSRLACKVVQMGNQTLHNIGQALIGRLRVYDDGVLSDVVDG
jgi:hypothetical protein